jgi:hypothetical protein
MEEVELVFGDVAASSSGLPPEHAEPPAKRLKKTGAGSSKACYKGGPEGTRWCKGCGAHHPKEEFGPKDSMCRESKAAYEGAMTQAKDQSEQKFS